MNRFPLIYSPENDSNTGRDSGACDERGAALTSNPDTSQIRPEQENNSSGKGVAGTDSEGRIDRSGTGNNIEKEDR